EAEQAGRSPLLVAVDAALVEREVAPLAPRPERVAPVGAVGDAEARGREERLVEGGRFVRLEGGGDEGRGRRATPEEPAESERPTGADRDPEGRLRVAAVERQRGIESAGHGDERGRIRESGVHVAAEADGRSPEAHEPGGAHLERQAEDLVGLVLGGGYRRE